MVGKAGYSALRGERVKPNYTTAMHVLQISISFQLSTVLSWTCMCVGLCGEIMWSIICVEIDDILDTTFLMTTVTMALSQKLRKLHLSDRLLHCSL